MSDTPDYVEPKGEDEGAIRTVQKNLLSIALLAIAGIAFIVLMFYGAFNDTGVQALMIWAILGLIALSILIAMREKLMMMLILYGAFALGYLIESRIVSGTNVGDAFSWGTITFGMISVFVYAVGLSKGFTQKHVYIFVIFLITAWLLNAGGWMSKGNELSADAMARLAGGIGNAIWTVIYR